MENIKPYITVDKVNQFLDGIGSHANIEHVRYIDVPYWSNEGTIIIRTPDDEIKYKQIPYEPFLWSKEIDFNIYFCYKTVEIPILNYNINNNIVLFEGEQYIVDGQTVFFDKICPADDSKGIFRFYIENIKDRERFFLQKKNEYNIVEEKLIVSYSESPIERMEKGYKKLFKIKAFPSDPKNPQNTHYSTNPHFKYKNDGRINTINGSYNDLISFFKEGGLDVYEDTGVYLDPYKLKNYFENLKLSDKIFFYLNTITPFKNKKGHIDIFKDFWDSSSFNEDLCLDYIKKSEKYKNKLKDFYIEQAIFNNETVTFDVIPHEFHDKIIYTDNNLYIKDIKNIYVSNKNIPNTHNFIQILNGYEKFGDNWENIKEIIQEEITDVAIEIQKYYPHKVIIDKDLKSLLGKHFQAFYEFLLDTLNTFHESKSYYTIVDEEGNDLEMGEPENNSVPKSITKGRLLEYLDIFNVKELLLDLYKDNIIIQIFNPKINYYFVNDLYNQKNKFSLHTSKYGRKFINICEQKNYDILTIKESLFQTLPPVTQFMYQTGIRLFKGYEFNDLKRLVFDIETRPQKGHENNNRAALDPTLGEIFKIGIWTNKGYTKILSANSPEEEKQIIEETYQIFASQNPDIILGYNSEFFDFPFMEKRLELLGGVAEDRNGIFTSIEYIREIIGKTLRPQYENLYISNSSLYKKKKSSVKTGGDLKDTGQTYIFGINVMDGIHQTWKLMAINKKIEFAGLKYNIKTNKIAKSNRVYIKGDDIGKIGNETRPIYLNDQDGDWFINEIKVEFEKEIYQEKEIKTDENGDTFYYNTNYLYLYTNDSNDKIIKNCKNAFEINVLDSIGEPIDDDYLKNYNDYLTERFNNDLKPIIKDYDKIIIPYKRNGLSLVKNSPKTYKLLLLKLKDFYDSCQNLITIYSHIDITKYKQVSGEHIVERYLEDDLWETDVLFEKYAQSSFMLSKWCHNNLDRTANMGYASIWKVFISCWHYLNSIAVPKYDEWREINGGLIGMVTSGFCENVVKFDFSSLYPSYKDAYIPPPTWDISGISDYLLRFFLYTRLEYKALSKDYFSKGDMELGSKYDILQHPLKIFINSYFGFLGATYVSPYADMISAHFITAGSRQVARHMHNYMKQKNYITTYMHTDGLNKIYPKNVENKIYIGKGTNWLVRENKEYKGLAADVAEYNDKFFTKGKMGLGIDGIDVACINIAKSNVVHFKKKEKDGKISYEVEITGGLVKKDTPEYIKKFIDEYTPILMKGDSDKFISGYYNYINKIWNHKIKAKDISNKVKLKDINEYLTKAKVKSAPYELIIKNKIDVTSGNYFYWVNTGENEGDVDYTIEKKKIGYFILDMKNPDLEKIIKNKNTPELKNIIEKAYEKELFVFSKSRTENGLEENKDYLNELNNLYDLKFEYKKKKIKKEEVLTLELELHIEKFNCKHVNVHDYEATVSYNQQKYLSKFNSAIEPLFIVFHPDTRKKIIKNTPDSKYGFIKPMLTENETKLINGIPLEGKEENQQKLINLMKVQPIEKRLWLDVKCDPNWIVTGKKLEKNEYWIKNKKYFESEIDNFDCIVNLVGIINFLSENPIIDNDSDLNPLTII